MSFLTMVKKDRVEVQEKIEYIKSYLKKYGYIYREIIDEKSVNEIYDLYSNNIEHDSSDGMVLTYYGLFYNSIKEYTTMVKYYLMAIDLNYDNAMNNLALYYERTQDYVSMMKYYLMAIDKGNSYAMYNLGYYYGNIKDYPNMKKYYLMAIDKGNYNAMCNLGIYYSDIKDYASMEKYYLMAIDKGNSSSMHNLGYYYCEIKDYSSMEKYYQMAIDKGNSSSMHNLGIYYWNIKDYSSMEKYYLMAIKHGCENSEKRLAEYYKNNKLYEQLVYMYFDLVNYINLDESNKEKNKLKLIQSLDLYIPQMGKDIPKRIIEIISELDLTDTECSFALRLICNILKQKIDIIDLHYNYSPGEKGCKDAKDDFISRCITK